MSGQLSGSFPGGPSRRDQTPQRSGPPRLRRMADIEETFARRSLDRRRDKRRSRLVAGFVGMLLVAGVAGVFLGLQSHTTAEEITAAREEANRRELDLSSEVNRTLLELWKMEDVEAARSRGNTR